MERLIYVFNKIDRDELICTGFKLLKCDEKSDVYIFANRVDMSFDLAGHTYVRSNTLTF